MNTFVENCTESEFSCGPKSTQCIAKTWQCDGETDCLNGYDEARCGTGKQ